MTSRRVKIITGVLGVMLMGWFVLGLAHSISTGFAGFKGGLPFVVIAVFVLLLAIYDFWSECVRKND